MKKYIVIQPDDFHHIEKYTIEEVEKVDRDEYVNEKGLKFLYNDYEVYDTYEDAQEFLNEEFEMIKEVLLKSIERAKNTIKKINKKL